MNKETYDNICKGRSCPSFENMELQFSVSAITAEESSLKAIAKKMHECIKDWGDRLESVINPESASFANLMESEHLEDNDKKEAILLYKKLCFYSRKHDSLELEYSDEKAASFINEFFGEWIESKSKLLALVEKFMNFWKLETKKDDKEGYFG
ncbi:MAG: hypothetical protein V1659_04595 [Candidatus Woesearchaeota archaeon]